MNDNRKMVGFGFLVDVNGLGFSFFAQDFVLITLFVFSIVDFF